MTPITWALLAALLAALALAYLLWRGARRGQEMAGVRAQEVVYQDTADREEARPLYAPHYGLAGKPDYLLRRKEGLIPVEIKPSRRADKLFASDVMQLAAYCLLVEEASGQAPPYGLLRYGRRTFRVAYSTRLKEALLSTLAAMRRDAARRDVRRSHHDPERCRHCGQREHCRDRLVT
jgi:CRISPR-associated exonuclease Cas4